MRCPHDDEHEPGGAFRRGGLGGVQNALVGGGFIGGMMINKVNQKALRLFVVLIGLGLTVGLFLRAS